MRIKRGFSDQKIVWIYGLFIDENKSFRLLSAYWRCPQTGDLLVTSLESMANNSSNTGNSPCMLNPTSLFLAYLAGMLMHILIVRALVSKLKLRKPMHKFLLSLSVADLIHMISFIVTMPIVSSMKPNVASATCRNARRALSFFFYLMTASSSGSIIALSVERYIACIHCFRLHSILTKKRTIVSIGLIWCAGLITGMVTEILYAVGSNMTIDRFEHTQVIYAQTVLIFGTSAVLFFVQARLFVLVRIKMRFHPGETTSQARSTFLRQVKTSVAVGAVVVVYLTCLLPLAMLPFLKPNMSAPKYVAVRRIFTLFNLLNPVLDPFIYGIGLMEIRTAILADFRTFMRYVVIKIFRNA